MHKSKINPLAESKLSQTVAKIISEKPIEKSGFITSSNNKTTHYKTKTFRLRQLDAENLIKIIKAVNHYNHRKTYSDSEVIRGLINFISDNLDTNVKKLTNYINASS
jgi:predicted transcriptional regulator